MTAQLLPLNATPLERACEEVAAEVLGVPVPFDTLWNPDSCPAELLHVLAATYSVDEWGSGWSDERKRSVIKATPAYHRVKGTPGALKRAIAALGYGLSVEEWFQYGGDPYRFRLVLEQDATVLTVADYQTILRVALAAKNVRSFLDGIRTKARHRARCPVVIGVQSLTIKARVLPYSLRNLRQFGRLHVAFFQKTALRYRVLPQSE